MDRSNLLEQEWKLLQPRRLPRRVAPLEGRLVGEEGETISPRACRGARRPQTKVPTMIPTLEAFRSDRQELSPSSTPATCSSGELASLGRTDATQRWNALQELGFSEHVLPSPRALKFNRGRKSLCASGGARRILSPATPP